MMISVERCHRPQLSRKDVLCLQVALFCVTINDKSFLESRQYGDDDTIKALLVNL